MPTAFFVSSDIQAVGTLGAISAVGLRCPEDISIAGFDDIEPASHLGLTTMRQQMYEMVMWAAESLLARLEDPSQKPTQTLFVPKLVIRNTSRARVSQEYMASETAE